MKDKFHLETYREHEIWYNADTDKFTVELLVENDWREKGRKSLKDCRKVIDEHIKANTQFKPFKCIRSRWGDGDLITVEQIRADGGFVFVNEEGKKQTEISDVIDQLKDKKRITYYKFHPDYPKWKEEGEKLSERHQSEVGKHKKEMPKLEPLDLEFVKQFITPL